MTSDALLMPQPTPSFLRFGTQSVLIHVVGIAILNILQFSHTVEKPKPVVKVSLVKTQPQPKKVELEPPPMLQTQRQRRAVEPQRMMPSQQPVPLPERVQVAQVTPEPTRPQSPQPLKRRILQDSRASDTLKLKDFTKTARSHRPTTSTKTKTDGSAMAIPAFSTIATLRGISTKVSTLPASSRVGSSARPVTDPPVCPDIRRVSPDGRQSETTHAARLSTNRQEGRLGRDGAPSRVRDAVRQGR